VISPLKCPVHECVIKRWPEYYFIVLRNLLILGGNFFFCWNTRETRMKYSFTILCIWFENYVRFIYFFKLEFSVFLLVHRALKKLRNSSCSIIRNSLVAKVYIKPCHIFLFSLPLSLFVPISKNKNIITMKFPQHKFIHVYLHLYLW